MTYDEIYEDLITIGQKHGFRPDVPIETEDFFRDLVASYRGPNDHLLSWLDEEAVKNYRFLVHLPRWLQEPEWPLIGGRPMTFVGQIELPKGSAPALNHSAAFYVFWDSGTGATKVVVQAD
jgi:hypothetical protein